MVSESGPSTPNLDDVLKVAFICDDPVVVKRFFGYMVYNRNAWQMRSVSSLRLLAPSETIQDDELILYWYDHNIHMFLHDQWKNQIPPSRNSVSGVLETFKNFPIEKRIFERFVLISQELSRNDITFLGAEGLTNIMVMPPSNTLDAKILTWFQNLDDLLRHIFIKYKKNPPDEPELIFIPKILNWDQMSQNEKQSIKEDLKRTFQESARYYTFMADIAVIEGNLSLAEEYLNKAIHKNPNYIQAFNKLAQLMLTQDRIQEGIKIWDYIRNVVPNRVEYLKGLYTAYQKLHMHERMERHLLKALHLAPFDQHSIDTVIIAKQTSENPEINELKIKPNEGSDEVLEHSLKRIEEHFNKYEYKKSLKLCFETLKLKESRGYSHEIFFWIGMNYAKQMEFELAEKMFLLSLVRKPFYTKATQALDTLKSLKTSA